MSIYRKIVSVSEAQGVDKDVYRINLADGGSSFLVDHQFKETKLGDYYVIPGAGANFTIIPEAYGRLSL